MTHVLPLGSAHTGELPLGCRLCAEGAKMVLLVTGLCDTGCPYCPLSNDRSGRDVMYANEMRLESLEEALIEARAMDALGTGITGGDPLVVLGRTLDAIRMLRAEFGPGHHMHLYTSSVDVEAFRELEAAGLDELRLHPPERTWARPDYRGLEEFVRGTRMDIGFELPALPGRGDDLRAMVRYARGIGMGFVNLNELEFSEGNYDALLAMGLEPRDETSAAIAGSREVALGLMDEGGIALHLCSSAFKDGVQLRNRFKRRAERSAMPYDVVTDDGTVLRGIVETPDPIEEMRSLSAVGVPDDLMRADVEKGVLEVAAWVLEDLVDHVQGEPFLVELHPTADALEVERAPLRRR